MSIMYESRHHPARIQRLRAVSLAIAEVMASLAQIQCEQELLNGWRRDTDQPVRPGLLSSRRSRKRLA
jgi:hypothetical protein